MSTGEVVQSAEEELRARIRGWHQMEARAVQDGMQAEIREVAMCWGARRAVMLADDLEFRREGRDAYIQARLTGQTTLQKLVKENLLRVAQLPVDDAAFLYPIPVPGEAGVAQGAGE